MLDLSTRYMGLHLRNPIIVSSSGLTQTLEGVQRCADAGAGAVVLKSIFEEQIEAEVKGVQGSIGDSAWHPEAEEYIARFGREEAVGVYLRLIREAKQALPIPVIASVHCVTAGAWTEFAERVEEAGADALELNVFVLPSDPKRDARETEQVYFDIAREVTRRVSIPVALKVGSYFSALSQTLVELSRTGIRGLVLFNRFFHIDFDIERLELVPARIHSVPEEMVVPLRWISILSGRVACDLAATTGVHDGEGVVKQLLAGASAVEVCSKLYEKDVSYMRAMLAQMTDWMGRKGFRTVDQFRGKMSQAQQENPAAYERVQFMKATAGVE
jgi:dihydroorotate dehydrogenase (fumarate)